MRQTLVKICRLQDGKRGMDLTPTIYKGKIGTLPSNSLPSKVSLSYFNNGSKDPLSYWGSIF